jgi:hypothetical protein
LKDRTLEVALKKGESGFAGTVRLPNGEPAQAKIFSALRMVPSIRIAVNSQGMALAPPARLTKAESS